MNSLQIFVDLDGVLANFDGKMKELYPEFDGDVAKTNKKMKSKAWNMVTQYQKTGYFWYDLQMMPDAIELWYYVNTNFTNVKILTACGQPQYKAGEQKLKWVTKHLGKNVDVILVEHSKHKASYATPNTILIDDMGKSIVPFIQAGGIGILHTGAANSIEQLKEIISRY